jgi:hypothetical protein
MIMDPYMKRADELVRQGKAVLESRAARMLAAAPSHSVSERRRKLMNWKTRYGEVHRRFEMLRGADTANTADLKVALEKAIDTFRAEIGWKA